MKQQCPLCENETNQKLSHQSWGERREFYHCHNCDLIFVPSKYFASDIQDKSRYGTHENQPTDQGYIDFLSRIFSPMDRVIPEWKGFSRALDYGSGPRPVLAQMMTQLGVPTDHYDLYFQNDRSKLQKKYSLVVSTEVVEHFKNLQNEWSDLFGFVEQGGYLVIMTQFHRGSDHFQSWWYAKDFTHIHFYSEDTLKWIASKEKMNLTWCQDGVAIYKRHMFY